MSPCCWAKNQSRSITIATAMTEQMSNPIIAGPPRIRKLTNPPKISTLCAASN